MTEYPEAAQSYDERLRELALVAVAASRRAWRAVQAEDLSGSWAEGVRRLSPILSEVQFLAASAGSGYVGESLAAQGSYVLPDSFVDPRGFAGVAPDGRPLESLLFSPITQVKAYIGNGAPPLAAMKMGRSNLDLLARTITSDGGRAAAGVDIASRAGVGYVRMLNPPSCSRCAVLAGKFYRWNAGFARHPACDCKHIPSSENVEGDLRTDPYEYFQSLNPQDQVRLFGDAESKAINDGADLFQVVNSRRGIKPGGLITKEGTTRRGNFGRGRPPRLTPEGIYSQGLPRDETLRLLERNGYILPGGQNPTGTILGQREGFGALGRGGTRVGAREAVLEARMTGVRNPETRATMTAAERRVFDAQTRWDQVRKGINPLNPKKPLTPEIAARFEGDYRKHVLGL